MDGSARLNEVMTTALEAFARPVVSDADYDAEMRANQEEELRRTRAERLDKLNVPLTTEMYKAIVSGELKPLPTPSGTSLTAVQRWMCRNDLPPCLIIAGQSGAGKSCAAAWAVANFSGATTWTSGRQLVRIFASTFEASDRKKQDRITSARLAVLDDVGTETDAVLMLGTLVEVLEQRKRLKTIVTTNLAEKDWRERYSDQRLQSRLKETVFVNDKGPDLRGKK